MALHMHRSTYRVAHQHSVEVQTIVALLIGHIKGHWTWSMFKIEVFNALQMRFGPSKYASLKTTPQKATPN